jgi:hypothetical protein
MDLCTVHSCVSCAACAWKSPPRTGAVAAADPVDPATALVDPAGLAKKAVAVDTAVVGDTAVGELSSGALPLQ